MRTVRTTLPSNRSDQKITLSPDGKIVGLVTFAGFFLIDASSGAVRRALDQSPVHEGWSPQQLVFSPDCRVVALSYGSGNFAVWNVKNGKRLFPPPGREREPKFANYSMTNFLAFSPDSKTLATANQDGTVQLWRLADFSVAQLAASGRSLQRLAFSSDGKLLATADYANVINLWSSDKKLLSTLTLLPQAAQEITAQTKAIAFDDKASTPPADEWLISIPEGYFACSTNAARYVLWNVNGKLYPAERYWKKFRRPDLVQKALRGEKITAHSGSQ